MLRTLLASVVAVILAATALPAQDTTSTQITVPGHDKSPWAARLIGIVPGAGHMYAGEVGTGFMYLGATAGIIVLGATMLAAECIGSLGESCEESKTPDVVSALAIGVWVWSIYDAGRAAHRSNARRRVRLSMIVAPVHAADAHGGGRRAVNLGLSVATH